MSRDVEEATDRILLLHLIKRVDELHDLIRSQAAPSVVIEPRKKRRKALKVSLRPPQGERNPNWRARYTDPDTQERKTIVLGNTECRTAETRAAFVSELSARIARRIRYLNDED